MVGDRLFLQGQQGDQQFVFAYDVNSGKQIWKSPTGKPFAEQHGNGPRGTPTVDGARLYAVSADGTLVCLEIGTGKRVWAVNFTDNFKGRQPHWAYTESPLIDGNRIIVAPGGPEAGIMALNKTNGEVIWKSQGDKAGYSSAVALDVAGTHALALLTGEAAIGLSMKDGALLWRFPESPTGPPT